MNGLDVRTGRRAKGWRQEELARRLRVSQGYVSLLERDRRRVPARLAEKLVRVLDLPATDLPVRSRAPLDSKRAPRVLGALGHQGFGYLRRGRRLNPAEMLLRTLRVDHVDARVVEALVWVLVRFPNLDWPWLVRAVKQDDLQNRLGFLVALAREVAERRGLDGAGLLRQREETLAESRLQKVDTFSRGALTGAEERWLQVHSSETAKDWNVLSTLTADMLAHAFE